MAPFENVDLGLFLTLTRQKLKTPPWKNWRVTKPSQTKASKAVPDLDPKARQPGLAEQVSEWNAQHPVLAILLVSLLAVVINCYPIIFCGRSYVSPASVEPGTPIVYDWWPPLPGMENSIMSAPRHGRDTWATMLWGVPAGFIESRSLLDQGELPLWNRYSHAGDTFIGQAVSMLGDPLQLIVILGRGSAGSWDIKFLAAKFLFCVGFGLLVLRLLGSRALSLIYAALAAYCGAYFYIINHPSFFVFSYAPWILLSALGLLDLQSRRYVRWGLVWLLVNFACFNAGHVEVAVDLIAGLNLAALAYAGIGCRNVAELAQVLGRMAAGTLLFSGLTAPVWMSFLGTLAGAYGHSGVLVVQLPLKCLPGVFDDLFDFLLARTPPFDALTPETGLLVLVGCIIATWQWRQLKSDPFFLVNSGAIVLWGGCVFGWIPAFVLTAIPLLNRVGHTHSDFSYLLVIHLTIQSAYGFKCLAKAETFRRAPVVLMGMALVFEGMIVLAYGFGLIHWSSEWNYLFCAAAGAVGAPLLFTFFKSRDHQISAIRWLGIGILAFIPHYRFALYHCSWGNDDSLMLPGPRVVLNAPSRAVDKIKADNSGPFRVVGLDKSFFGDYSAVYGIEDIRSCAPLSNGEFINLFRDFPGIKSDGGWVIEVVDPVQAQPLLNLLNVKYLLAPPDFSVRGQPGFRLTDRSDFAVLENLTVWPRAFFSDKVISSSNEKFIKLLLANGTQPFIALTREEIEKQPGLQQLETTKPAVVSPATNYQLLPNATAFDVHATSAGMVCLTEGQAKDFTALANNEPKAVLTVNRAFKGIYLGQPGDYHIQFIYRPRHWRLACTLFWISAGVVIAWVAAAGIRARSQRSSGAGTWQK